jgi:hypothetical protein
LPLTSTTGVLASFFWTITNSESALESILEAIGLEFKLDVKGGGAAGPSDTFGNKTGVF